MKKFLQSIIWVALAFACSLASAQPVITKSITAINSTPTADCSANSCVQFDMQGKGGAAVSVRGTYTATGGLSLQRTLDGATWETVSSTSAFVPVGGTGTATITSAATGTWQVGGMCTGFLACRVTALGAVTGSANVTVGTTIASVGGSTSISGGAGDASAANQVTGNASLANIESYTSRLLSSAVPTAGGAATSTTALGVGGRYNATPPTLTDGQEAGAQLDSSGNLKVKASVASGGIASGAVASGAFASGALASGSVASGAMVDLGAQADSAAAADTSTASLIALTKRANQNQTTLGTKLDTLNTSINTAANYEATKDSAVPTKLVAIGARIGANEDAVAQGAATAAINVSTATTTQLVALSGTTKIYVTGLTVVAGGTGNITLVYGTGSACGTGTTSLSGAIPLVANSGFSLGSGLGAVLVVPAGQALCVTTSAAVQMSGFVTYAQF